MCNKLTTQLSQIHFIHQSDTATYILLFLGLLRKPRKGLELKTTIQLVTEMNDKNN